MKIIPVRLRTNAYSIVVGDNILGKIPHFIKDLKIGKDAIIITHPVIPSRSSKFPRAKKANRPRWPFK